VQKRSFVSGFQNAQKPFTMYSYMDKVPPAVRKARWLRHFTDAQWEMAMGEASFLSKPADTLVFSQGDVDGGLYYIAKGRIAVIKLLVDGGERFIRELGQGDFFGELSALDPAPRSTAIRTIETCDFIVIPRHVFVRCVEENSKLAMAIIVDLVRQIRGDDVRLDARMPVRERLWESLLELHRTCQGSGDSGGLTVKRTDLAMRCHADVKTISRELTKLEQEGLIQRAGRRILLCQE
jgi:CRP-like cAMP-binding protein